MRKMKLHKAILITGMLLVFIPGLAQAEPFKYSPDYCEFTITFPEKPQIDRMCEKPETQERCYDNVQFTNTFGLDATVDFKVICNAIDEDIRSRYSDQVIGATLETMTEGNVVEKFETNIHEGDGFKLAGIVGRGQKGMMETMYIAQLWIGSTSAMSLQAEMSGQQSKEADKMFTDILQSVYHKASYNAGNKATKEENAREETEKPATTDTPKTAP